MLQIDRDASERNGVDNNRRSHICLGDDRVKNFIPAWFAINMGTGSLSALLWSFPYGSQPVLHAIGTACLVLNILLFVVFCTISVVRFIRYAEVVHATHRHPVQSLYLGCFPMGFATIINTTLNINQGYGVGNKSLLYTLWGLWWIDSALSLGVYFLMLYTMITRHTHKMRSLTAVWLLPAVTPIVPATTGALLARAMLSHSTSHAILTLLASAVLLFLGLSLTFMIFPAYLFRLITKGLPDNTMIMSTFLPIGPCGQGGTAFVIIGQVFADISRRGSSEHILLSEPQVWNQLGIFCGFILWTLGIWWIVLAALSVYETFKSDPPQFTIGFWGVVFPLGVYAYLTLEISHVFGSATLEMVAAILALVVMSLWGILATKTTRQVLWNSKKLFQDPLRSGATCNSDPISGLVDQPDGYIRI